MYKWQPSLNKNQAHGNDVRPVERKQNCTLSEKEAWIARKIIRDAGNKIKKTNAKNQRCAQDYCKVQTAGNHLISQKDHITDSAAVLDTPSTTIQGTMEPNLAHKLLLWRKEQRSAEKSQLMKLTGCWVVQDLTKKTLRAKL